MFYTYISLQVDVQIWELILANVSTGLQIEVRPLTFYLSFSKAKRKRKEKRREKRKGKA